LNILAALIPDIFTAKHCLDVGCNAGSVSNQLGKSRIVGRIPLLFPVTDYYYIPSILTVL
jgi:hypothetical protein